jgi:hypothetical protein
VPTEALPRVDLAELEVDLVYRDIQFDDHRQPIDDRTSKPEEDAASEDCHSFDHEAVLRGTRRKPLRTSCFSKALIKGETGPGSILKTETELRTLVEEPGDSHQRGMLMRASRHRLGQRLACTILLCIVSGSSPGRGFLCTTVWDPQTHRSLPSKSIASMAG